MSVTPEDYRDALGRWPAGVSIVACRTEDRVVATTVSSLISLSLDPPLVLVAFGANATVLPFLQPGARFAISVLAASQRRLASVYADPMPVGPSPFPAEGDPVVAGAVVALTCSVQEVRAGGDHHIVIARVAEVGSVADVPPLVRFRRRYHTLGPEGP
jgi:flavin reductase (DIM6/NTAB) family NADH-FMN oxidoreductase RutF